MVGGAKTLSAGRQYTPEQIADSSADGFIDLGMASRISGVAPVTLRAQAAAGRLRAVRLGGRWVTKRRWLREYLDNRPQYLKARTRGRSVPVEDDISSVPLNDDLEVWILLQQAWQTMQKARDKELTKHNVSLKQSHILFLVDFLVSTGVPVTVGELTRWTLLEKHSVFERIKRMERGGLVKRVPGREGLKAKELVLTEAGRQALERAANRESISIMLSALSPEERQQLKLICKKLRDAAVAIIEDYTRRVLL